MADRPTAYSEFAELLNDLPIVVRAARRMYRLSQRELAQRTGISYSTVSRIESGGEFSSVSLLALLTWLAAAGRAKGAADHG